MGEEGFADLFFCKLVGMRGIYFQFHSGGWRPGGGSSIGPSGMYGCMNGGARAS